MIDFKCDVIGMLHVDKIKQPFPTSNTETIVVRIFVESDVMPDTKDYSFKKMAKESISKKYMDFDIVSFSVQSNVEITEEQYNEMMEEGIEND